MTREGTLFIVATPVGNLGDITLRALEVLRSVDAVLAEDTRRTAGLLTHYDIKKPLISFFEGNEERKILEVLEQLKRGGQIALVSDAGTPLISDPGFKLVREAIKQGIKVDSIPGPSAITLALTLSGLPPDKFIFLGYLPKTSGKAQKVIEHIKKILEIQNMTVILFESPYRLIKTLILIKQNLGDIAIVVCRELTKVHQEVRRENISDVIAHFEKVAPKGEFTILFNRV